MTDENVIVITDLKEPKHRSAKKRHLVKAVAATTMAGLGVTMLFHAKHDSAPTVEDDELTLDN